jgi:hypothetical protein
MHGRIELCIVGGGAFEKRKTKNALAVVFPFVLIPLHAEGFNMTHNY